MSFLSKILKFLRLIRKMRSGDVVAVSGLSRREFVRLTGGATILASLPLPVARKLLEDRSHPIDLDIPDRVNAFVAALEAAYGISPSQRVIFCSKEGLKKLKQALVAEQRFPSPEDEPYGGFQPVSFCGFPVHVCDPDKLGEGYKTFDATATIMEAAPKAVIPSLLSLLEKSGWDS